MVSSVGLALPHSSAIAMDRHRRIAGAASALFGLAQFALGAVTAPLVGLGDRTTGLALAVTAVVAVLIGVVALLIARPIIDTVPATPPGTPGAVVTAGRGEVVEVSTSLTVRCAFLTYRLPADWYFPVGEPRALVWAQHGFAQSRKVWTDFATRAARAGFLVVAPTLPTADLFGCTVQNLGNNTRFLGHVATLFDRPAVDGGVAVHPGTGVGAGALLASFLGALGKSGLGESGLGESGLGESGPSRSGHPSNTPASLPDKVAFVGHSAGGEAALYLAGRLIEARGDREVLGRPELAGVVLADPVTSVIDRTMAGSLEVLDRSDIPVLTVASPPNSCNAHHRGVAVVVDSLASRPFIGVQVTGGSHADLLGASVGAVERRVCGRPEPKNVEAAQALTVGWLGEMLGGESSPGPPGCQPGGATYEGLRSAGVIAPLG